METTNLHDTFTTILSQAAGGKYDQYQNDTKKKTVSMSWLERVFRYLTSWTGLIDSVQTAAIHRSLDSLKSALERSQGLKNKFQAEKVNVGFSSNKAKRVATEILKLFSADPVPADSVPADPQNLAEALAQNNKAKIKDFLLKEKGKLKAFDTVGETTYAQLLIDYRVPRCKKGEDLDSYFDGSETEEQLHNLLVANKDSYYANTIALYMSKKGMEIDLDSLGDRQVPIARYLSEQKDMSQIGTLDKKSLEEALKGSQALKKEMEALQEAQAAEDNQERGVELGLAQIEANLPLNIDFYEFDKKGLELFFAALESKLPIRYLSALLRELNEEIGSHSLLYKSSGEKASFLQTVYAIEDSLSIDVFKLILQIFPTEETLPLSDDKIELAKRLGYNKETDEFVEPQTKTTPDRAAEDTGAGVFHDDKTPPRILVPQGEMDARRTHLSNTPEQRSVCSKNTEQNTPNPSDYPNDSPQGLAVLLSPRKNPPGVTSPRFLESPKLTFAKESSETSSHKGIAGAISPKSQSKGIIKRPMNPRASLDDPQALHQVIKNEDWDQFDKVLAHSKNGLEVPDDQGLYPLAYLLMPGRQQYAQKVIDLDYPRVSETCNFWQALASNEDNLDLLEFFMKKYSLDINDESNIEKALISCESPKVLDSLLTHASVSERIQKALVVWLASGEVPPEFSLVLKKHFPELLTSSGLLKQVIIGELFDDKVEILESVKLLGLLDERFQLGEHSMTLLEAALTTKKEQVAHRLLDLGAKKDCHFEGESLVSIAKSKNFSDEFIKRLEQELEPKQELKEAINTRNLVRFKTALEKGIDLSQEEDCVGLARAMYEGYDEFVEVLLNHPFNLNGVMSWLGESDIISKEKKTEYLKKIKEKVEVRDFVLSIVTKLGDHEMLEQCRDAGELAFIRETPDDFIRLLFGKFSGNISDKPFLKSYNFLVGNQILSDEVIKMFVDVFKDAKILLEGNQVLLSDSDEETPSKAIEALKSSPALKERANSLSPAQGLTEGVKRDDVVRVIDFNNVSPLQDTPARPSLSGLSPVKEESSSPRDGLSLSPVVTKSKGRRRSVFGDGQFDQKKVSRREKAFRQSLGAGIKLPSLQEINKESQQA